MLPVSFCPSTQMRCGDHHGREWGSRAWCQQPMQTHSNSHTLQRNKSERPLCVNTGTQIGGIHISLLDSEQAVTSNMGLPPALM